MLMLWLILDVLNIVIKVKIGFLQDNNSWIFLPENVQFSFSENGKDFSKNMVVPSDVALEEEGSILKDFEIEINKPIRFIKIIGTNIGNCPEWHKGAGNKCWIFADEIVIE